MIIAIYARVSTDQQAEKGYSMATQLSSCREKALEFNNVLSIEEFLDEGYSGAYLDRPGLEKLRNGIRAKRFGVVIVYDPDRLARNLTHQLITTDEIEASGARLVFVNFEWQDTPEGKLFYSIRGAVSAYEREKIKERSQRGKRGKALAGKIVRNNHPYGYNWDSVNSMYTVNEEEAKMIRQIFTWVVDEHMGIRAIATRLAKMNYPTRTNNNSWNIGTVHDIIRRETYAGVYWANREYKTKIGQNLVKRGTRNPSEWISVTVPPIITREVWEAAQHQLTENKHITKQPILFSFLCRNLVVCSLCGSRLRSVVSGTNRKPYYVCKTGRAISGKSRIGQLIKCPARQVPAELFDEIVWSYVSGILKDPTLLTKELENSGQSDTDYIESFEQRLEQLFNRKQQLTRDRDKIINLFRQDLIEQPFVVKQLKQIKRTLEELHEEIIMIERQSEERKNIRLNDTLKDQLVFNTKSADSEDVQVQRKILQTVIDLIEVARTDNHNTGKVIKAGLSIRIHFLL